MSARQVMYHFSQTSCPFSYSYFLDRVSHFFPQTGFRLQSSSFCLPVAGTTGMLHNIQFVDWDEVLLVSKVVGGIHWAGVEPNSSQFPSSKDLGLQAWTTIPSSPWTFLSVCPTWKLFHVGSNKKWNCFFKNCGHWHVLILTTQKSNKNFQTMMKKHDPLIKQRNWVYDPPSSDNSVHLLNHLWWLNWKSFLPPCWLSELGNFQYISSITADLEDNILWYVKTMWYSNAIFCG
jgi:hypothetical protein